MSTGLTLTAAAAVTTAAATTEVCKESCFVTTAL